MIFMNNTFEIIFLTRCKILKILKLKCLLRFFFYFINEYWTVISQEDGLIHFYNLGEYKAMQ